ncbi:hypothetical protein LSAT2_005590 [Lamellibrachia satsuma]|nr:hypothetical protein LSAT2_005590 [Lamellibrachia satsuma]
MRDIGLSQQQRDIGLSQQQSDTGLSQQQRDIGLSQQQRDIGLSQQQRDIGLSQHQHDIGLSQQQRDIGGVEYEFLRRKTHGVEGRVIEAYLVLRAHQFVFPGDVGTLTLINQSQRRCPETTLLLRRYRRR